MYVYGDFGIAEDSLILEEDVQATLDLAANDVPASGIQAALVDPPSSGSALLSSSVLEYEPAADFFGDDVLSYSASIAEKVLASTSGQVGDQQGFAVDSQGKFAIVGAPEATHDGHVRAGAAFIFRREGDAWSPVTTLVSTSPQENGRFGYSVSIDGEYIVVGTFGEEAAYIYERNFVGNEWSLVDRLTNEVGGHVDLGLGVDRFGSAVAVDGDTIVIGAFGDNQSSLVDVGSAVVFKPNPNPDLQNPFPWKRVKTLVPVIDGQDDGQAFDHFGFAVDIDGDSIIVGAYSHDSGGVVDSGAAYIFDRSEDGEENWGWVRRINGPSFEAGANFGAAVAIKGNIAIVGAPNDDRVAVDAGAAYVFNRDNVPVFWGLSNDLTAANASAGDSYGHSVALSDDGNLALVGAPLSDSVNVDAGATYLHERNQGGSDKWGQTREVLPTNGQSGDQFGTAVSISDSRVLVGAIFSSVAGTPMGSSHLIDLRRQIADVTITVESVNDVPEFVRGPDVVVDEDAGFQSIANWATGISAGASNESEQTVSFEVTSSNPGLFSTQPSLDTDGTLSFVPADNVYGEAIVTVTALDDGGTENGGVDRSAGVDFTITVNQVNDPGKWGGDLTASIDEDVSTSGTVTFTDVADGFTTPSFVLADDATSGGAAIDAAGNWSYTPDGNFNGTDSFTVSVTDDDGNVQSQVIVITVNQVNDPGTFGGDLTASTDEDVPTSGAVTFADASDGFTTPNFVLTTDATSGGAAIDAAGNWSYTPDADFNGTDSFTVSVSDDDGNVESQEIAITIVQVNDLVVEAGLSQFSAEGSVVSLDPATFSDAGSLDTHTAAIDWGDGSAPVAGLVDAVSGTISGDHVYADNGVYTVSVTVTDSDGASARDSFTVTVSNAAPTLDAGPDQGGLAGSIVAQFGSGLDGNLTVASGQTYYVDSVRTSLVATAAAGDVTMEVVDASVMRS